MRTKWLVAVVLVSLVALVGIDTALAPTKWQAIVNRAEAPLLLHAGLAAGVAPPGAALPLRFRIGPSASRRHH